MSGILIRLKGKPKKPKRKLIRESVIVYGEENLQSILDCLGNPDPKDAIIKIDCFDYNADLSVIFNRPMTDEEFEREMTKYKKRLDQWESWYEENKELIEKEKARRKQEKMEKYNKDQLKKLKMFKKEIKKIEDSWGVG